MQRKQQRVTGVIVPLSPDAPTQYPPKHAYTGMITVLMDGGGLVYGTCPEILYAEGEGTRVTFLADVEPAKHRGIAQFKHPRAAEVI